MQYHELDIPQDIKTLLKTLSDEVQCFVSQLMKQTSLKANFN